ncbi:hypothetical protein XENOCAPTIV_030979, partial [Xenoophorus captivus]
VFMHPSFHLLHHSIPSSISGTFQLRRNLDPCLNCMLWLGWSRVSLLESHATGDRLKNSPAPNPAELQTNRAELCWTDTEAASERTAGLDSDFLKGQAACFHPAGPASGQ